MDNKIEAIINAVFPVSGKAKDKIKNLVEYITVKKGESITSIGENNNFEYFLIEGTCKSFLYNTDGDDITLSFFMSGSVMSPSTTRVRTGKSIINMRALTDVVIGVMNAEAFEKLMIEDVEIRAFGNTVLRDELMHKVQKEIALASLKGKDRLKLLRETFPNIENLVSHSDIASYLGLTTISLSRLGAQS